MTPEDYRASIKRLGLNQTTVAQILGIDARTSRRYAKQGPPPPLARLLAYIERYGVGLAEEMMEERMAISMPERGSVSLDENTAEYLSTIMDQRKTIDALVAALEEAREAVWRYGDTTTAIAKLDAALALARGGK